MPETLTARQRQTLNGRRALADRFPTPEARTQHYRELGRRSAERRLVLSGNEAVALRDAYALLRTIAERIPDSTEAACESESPASGSRPAGDSGVRQ